MGPDIGLKEQYDQNVLHNRVVLRKHLDGPEHLYITRGGSM